MTESMDITPDITETLLRNVCEAELTAARALRADADNLELQSAWIKAHGDRMRATHPVNILVLLDRIEGLRLRLYRGADDLESELIDAEVAEGDYV